jgi:glycosyltransferase involved in cell wall biosynthesis
VKNKKVLVVITTGFTSWGGLTNAYMNYYRPMDKSGLQIDIASVNKPEKELRQEVEKNGGKYILFANKRKSPLKYYYDYWKICGTYDVVHIHGNSPTVAGELFLAKIKKVPVRIAHNHNSRGMHPVFNVLLSPIFNASYTVGLACSKEAGDWVYKKNQYIVLNNAIDSKKYRYDEEMREKLRCKYKIEKDEILFGHVGKFVAAKNHMFLLEVFEKVHKNHPKTKLILVGDGSFRPQIEERIKELYLQDFVILAGMQKDTSGFYSAMDCFLFPSIHEGLPLALLEAQASGLNIITSLAVSPTANLTGDIVYQSIEYMEPWILMIENMIQKCNGNDRTKKSINAIKAIKKAKFDNLENGQILRNLYFGKYNLMVR